MKWRFGEVVSEGIRSFFAGGIFSIASAVVAGAIFASGTVADMAVLSRLVDDEAYWRDNGGTLLIATSADGRIESQSCDEMNNVAGVEAAFGATRFPDGYTIRNAPGSPVTVVTATHSANHFFGYSEMQGAIVSERLTDRGVGRFIGLDVASNERLAPEFGSRDGVASLQGTYLVSGLGETVVLGEEFASVVILPGSAEDYVDACFIRAAPHLLNSIRAAAPALVLSSSGPTIVADRRISGEFTRDYSAEFASRPTALAPFVAGGLVAIVWIGVSWFRRSESALYEALGAARFEVQAVRAVEYTVLLVWALAFCWAIVIAWMLWASDAWILWESAIGRARWSVVASACFAFAVGVAGSSLVRGKSVLASLKDR